MKVLYSVQQGIGQLTLSNPPHNALVDPVFAELDELQSFLAQPDLRAVLVTGAGKHFCAGAELGRLEQDLQDPEALACSLAKARALLEALSFAPVPLLAVVRGSCLGAGLEIALACHFRFAARGAMVGFPEAGHRLLPGLGGTAWLQQVVRRGVLVELLLSSRMVGAAEAEQMGLLDRVLPAGELEPAARAFLQSLTDNRSAAVVHSVMTAIHNARRLPVDEALARETEIFQRLAARRADPSHPPSLAQSAASGERR